MITFYKRATPVCPKCVEAQAYLDKHEIDYTVVDVGLNADGLAFIKSRGHTTIPQLYVEGQLLCAGADGLVALMPEDVKARVVELSLPEAVAA